MTQVTVARPTPTSSFLKWLQLILRKLGPGMLMAGAAVGTSHLIQSTRAGVEYGWLALIAIFAANIFKYPFFEYGHRYAAATGQNLLQGYKQLGQGYLALFVCLNVVVTITSFSVLSLVMSALLQYLVFPGVSQAVLAAGTLLLCWGILVVGHYHWLEKLTKLLMFVLSITTLIVAVVAMVKQPVPIDVNIKLPSLYTMASLPFLISLMGWMPTSMEVSVFQSLWVQAQARDHGEAITRKDARFDFNVGYILIVVLAVLFLAMGTLAFSGQQMSDNGSEFVGQVIGMYGSVMGSWALPLVSVAAVATIFSTIFTIVDAYPRALSVGLVTLKPSLEPKVHRLRHGITAVAILIAVVMVAKFSFSFSLLINAATIIAFLAAPYIAWLNCRCVNGLKESCRPSRRLRIWAVVGMLYLLVFGGLYAVVWVV